MASADIKAPCSIEHRIVTRDGRIKHVEERWQTFTDAENHPWRAIGTCRDITDQKRAGEEKARLTDQLQQAMKMEAIGKLAGGVAHDFNNLLTVILSYTQFALGKLCDGDPVMNDLIETEKAAKRGAVLTRQLLAFGRKQILKPVALDLNQTAEGVKEMLRRILGEDVDLILALAPDLGVVLADAGQMEQVLMNLVINARDAMPEGGRLSIETSNVEIDAEFAASHVDVKPGSYVQLSVSDTGCGMDEQAMARLFEPFWTSKEKGKGTGLGLSMVYGIVKQSGGNIYVSSAPGWGTTFKIHLPRELSAATVAVTRPPKVSGRTTGTETILVVEDEGALLKVVRRTLVTSGYTVLSAANGDEALMTCAQYTGDIHLLLTDVIMPRMSGRALAQELLKIRPALKIVFMSGYTDGMIGNRGLLDEGTHFLGKPFTAADLTWKIREALDDGMDKPADGNMPETKANVRMERPPLDGDAIRALPPNVLEKLRKAVIAARCEEITALVEKIRTTRPDVADDLQRMADLFDYDGIRNILDGGSKAR
jgi:signal transduction histidine kinase/FixJ family two-component response regulator